MFGCSISKARSQRRLNSSSYTAQMPAQVKSMCSFFYRFNNLEEKSSRPLGNKATNVKRHKNMPLHAEMTEQQPPTQEVNLCRVRGADYQVHKTERQQCSVFESTKQPKKLFAGHENMCHKQPPYKKHAKTLLFLHHPPLFRQNYYYSSTTHTKNTPTKNIPSIK